MLLLWISCFPILSSLGQNIVQQTCPTWHISSLNGNSSDCECGPDIHGILECQENGQVGVLVEHCLTDTGEEVIVGYSPYCSPHEANSMHVTVPKNTSKLNNFMCGSSHRTGPLCSLCEKGWHLAAWSYGYECVNCSSTTTGILSYVVLVVVPSTVFFFVILLCNIRTFSGSINVVLSMIQIMLTQINQYPSNYTQYNSYTYYSLLVLLTLYGPWNLDFFRYVVPPICISESLTAFQRQALDYIPALFPLILIFLTYYCVKLHDNNCQIMRHLWRILPACFTNCTWIRQMDVKHSLISTFAVFLQLMHVRLMSISNNLLLYSKIMNVNGSTVAWNTWRNASVPYFSVKHLPYFTLAIFVTLIFNFLPFFITLVYPLKCFQKLLGYFTSTNWHPVHAFMDVYNSCYKNGTNGSSDCRYFVAFYLIFRFAMIMPSTELVSALVCIVLPLIFGYTVMMVKPYKNPWHNVWETFCLFSFGFAEFWLFCDKVITNLTIWPVFVLQLFVPIYILHCFGHRVLKFCFGKRGIELKLLWM